LQAEANSSVRETPGFLIQASHKHLAEPAGFVHAEVGRYRLRLARTVDDRDEACRLRFKVFNIELGEGLENAYSTGMDADHFDLFCDHLLVEDKLTRRIVGTYRMQSGASAALGLGYYSQQEFHLEPYEPLRPYVLELGRACIDREHRTPEVLTLLWRGIAQYAIRYGLRYLIGCSSIHSQDPHVGWAVYRLLHGARSAPEFETTPTAGYLCPVAERAGSIACESNMPSEVKVPRLLKAYLAIGARICSPPAWDRAFGTIDFLTLLDLEALSPAARHRFLGSAAS
jgi:putative hemolysin